jgi:hypothetical protein
MFVKTAKRDNVGGMWRNVPRPGQASDRKVPVAFGANKIHEFSHAFGLLFDEYIEGRNSEADYVNPATMNVFSLTNLSYSDEDSMVPWRHLSPWGHFRRQAAGDDPSPLVGWLWAGGGSHRGVWHAEYRCLMNGTHDNFQFTQDAKEDPTIGADGEYEDNSGAALRDRERFCLWCQELAVIRILEKTDRFLAVGDPPDINLRGQLWYERWINQLREPYFELFNVSQQVQDFEGDYAALTPGANQEPLWRSDLYRPFAADLRAKPGPLPALMDEEMFLVLTG